jgi:hypothetical protein
MQSPRQVGHRALQPPGLKTFSSGQILSNSTTLSGGPSSVLAGDARLHMTREHQRALSYRRHSPSARCVLQPTGGAPKFSPSDGSPLVTLTSGHSAPTHVTRRTGPKTRQAAGRSRRPRSSSDPAKLHAGLRARLGGGIHFICAFTICAFTQAFLVVGSASAASTQRQQFRCPGTFRLTVS